MDNYIGEIRIFTSTQAIPNGWALCDGTLLPVQQNSALFSLLGVQFGGNGNTTFALPDLRGRAPVSTRFNTPYIQGAAGGSASTTLNMTNLPAHTHPLQGSSAAANALVPTNNYLAAAADNEYATGTTVTMAPTMVSITGGSTPITNVQPYLGLIFAIAMVGIYPSRP